MPSSSILVALNIRHHIATGTGCGTYDLINYSTLKTSTSVMRTSTIATIAVAFVAASPALAYPTRHSPFESGVALHKDSSGQHYRAAVDRSHKRGAHAAQGSEGPEATGAHTARNFDLQELYARVVTSPSVGERNRASNEHSLAWYNNPATRHHVAVSPSVSERNRASNEHSLAWYNNPSTRNHVERNKQRIRDLVGLLARSP
ncbi:hypothetical protein C8Q72DRAFT_155543 [Fomitopsis betulina]|nr:hypothetical protein C8Q72DRAFT_155543 [Fomitopsis betulina]